MLKKIIQRILPKPIIAVLRKIKQKGLRFTSKGTPALIGMTSKDEQRFFTECATELFDANGTIVDLGSWMGSTAISLARGIQIKQKDNNTDTQKVYAFDCYIWESWMDPYLPWVQVKYKPGDTFLPEVQRRIHGYEHIIELVQTDLSKYVWQGDPIKILLVDAMKTWELARSITTSFFPSLKEGGVLIQQDFKHYYTPWIHILQYRLRDHFRIKHEVAKGHTVVFETIRQIPVDTANTAAQFNKVSDAEIKDAISYSMGCVSENQQSAIAAAHIMYFVHKGNAQKARDMLAKYASIYSKPTKEFSQVSELVESMDS